MFKVGDTGVTRGGQRYEVTGVQEHDKYPIVVSVGDGIDVVTADGRAWPMGESPADLMPPDPRPSETQPDRAALVELSSRVLAALCASNGHDDRDADGCARWAVAAARALLRECGA